MSLCSEADICVSNEKAVRLSICTKPPPLLEYIKTLSSLVGSSHILAVFEESKNIKVFFDDKKYVDVIVKNSIHVLGHHVKTDYVVPPGVKVILSNVDPIISNTDLNKLLSHYGSIVSPIIRPPISQDIELCHIGSGIRYTYMSLSACLPSSIEFKYGDQLYDIKLGIEDKQNALPIPYIKTDMPGILSDDDSPPNIHAFNNCDNYPGPSETEENESCEVLGPVVADVQTAIIENLQPLVRLESNVILTNGEVIVPTVKAVKKARGHYSKKNNFKKTTAVKAANKIKKNVKHNLASAKIRHYKRGQQKDQHKKNNTNSAYKKRKISTIPEIVNLEDEQTCYEDLSQNKVERIRKFIEEVKHHRAPLDIAKSFLGNDSKTILAFIEQLKQYQSTVNDACLRLRISRLIKTMRDALELE